MVAFAECFAACFRCRRVFGFHPHRVPSFRDENGERQAICRECFDRVNELRREKGLPPNELSPGAYGPFEESEL